MRHLTDAFRITGGSFNGESEYEGQIFCTRFEGVVSCHPHAKFSRTFDDFGTEGYTLFQPCDLPRTHASVCRLSAQDCESVP